MAYEIEYDFIFTACEYEEEVELYVNGKATFTDADDISNEFTVSQNGMYGNDVSDLIEKLCPSTFEQIQSEAADKCTDEAAKALTEWKNEEIA